MAMVHPSSGGHVQQDKAPCYKSKIATDWYMEHGNEWPPQSLNSNPTEHLQNVVLRKISILDVQPNYINSIEANFKIVLPEYCWTHAKNN